MTKKELIATILRFQFNTLSECSLLKMNITELKSIYNLYCSMNSEKKPVKKNPYLIEYTYSEKYGMFQISSYLGKHKYRDEETGKLVQPKGMSLVGKIIYGRIYQAMENMGLKYRFVDELKGKRVFNLIQIDDPSKLMDLLKSINWDVEAEYNERIAKIRSRKAV